MSAVNVTNVTVLDNPSMFQNPFQFEISYECLVPLKDDLEWKLIYVGSAEDEKYDQVLESVLVGPVNVGNYRFVFQADPPEASKIPEEDIIGVTVLLLTCSYVGQEFLRVGYYVSNEYVDEHLREEPPAKVVINSVQRNILAEKPRVTKFPIVFNATPPAPATNQVPDSVLTSNFPVVTDAEAPMDSASALGEALMESVPTSNYPMVTDAEARMESALTTSNFPMITDAEAAIENVPTSNYSMVIDGGVPMESALVVSEVVLEVEADDGARPMESSSPVVVTEMVESERDDGLRPMESSPRRQEQWKAAVPIECS